MSEHKYKVQLCCISCNDSVDIDPDDLDNGVVKFKKLHPTCLKLEGFVGGRSIGLFWNEDMKTFNRLLN
jgi:hypothetical protein